MSSRPHYQRFAEILALIVVKPRTQSELARLIESRYDNVQRVVAALKAEELVTTKIVGTHRNKVPIVAVCWYSHTMPTGLDEKGNLK